MRRYSRLPQVIFFFFYRSVYAFAVILVIGLLIVTPADHIFQTLEHRKIGNVVAVSATYAVTALVALFIYASRLYTNRSTLAAIPNPYLPIEPGEVPRNVRKEIVRGRQRAAIIAWETRPRDLRAEIAPTTTAPIVAPYANGSKTAQDILEDVDRQLFDESDPRNKQAHRLNHRRRRQYPNNRPPTRSRPRKLHKPAPPSRLMTNIVSYNHDDPPWGMVAHAGWAAPGADGTRTSHSSSDLMAQGPTDEGLIPFDTVIGELPHIIEAKVVSLAPADPAFDFLSRSIPDKRNSPDGKLAYDERREQRLAAEEAGIDLPPDPRALEILQRPKSMCLRDYVMKLAGQGFLSIPLEEEEILEEFVHRYEEARFSTSALMVCEFNALMECFARVLGYVKPLSLDEWDEYFQEAGLTAANDADGGRKQKMGDRDEVMIHSETSSILTDAGSVRRHVPGRVNKSHSSNGRLDEGDRGERLSISSSLRSSESIIHHTS